MDTLPPTISFFAEIPCLVNLKVWRNPFQSDTAAPEVVTLREVNRIRSVGTVLPWIETTSVLSREMIRFAKGEVHIDATHAAMPPVITSLFLIHKQNPNV